jgi:multidrug efflux system outer membrane protein
MKNLLLLTTTVLAAGALSGCAWLEPHFKLPGFGGDENVQASSAPAPFVSPTVVGSWQVAQPRVAEPRGNWWEMYNDPQLNDLMAQAAANNTNLQVMAARVKQARALASEANSSFFPTVDATAGATRQRTSPASFGFAGSATAFTLYQAGLDASYEFDLFGRISGESRNAKFQELAQEDLYQSAKLAMQADVVNAWYGLRAASAAQAAADESLKLGEEALALVKKRYDVGDISNAEFQQASANLLSQRNSALNIAQQANQARNQLATLVGKPAPSFSISATAITELPPVVPAGISSTVLQRRPDVAAAEHQLAAANARIGAARAAFFPSITLSGNAGFASTDLGNLFKWNNLTWAAGPAISLPIFQGGALLDNLRYSKGQYEEAVATYKGQVLSAFQDTANGLDGQRTATEQAAGQQQAYAALAKSTAASKAQYDTGDISKLDYISARQTLLNAQISEQQSLLNAYTASTALIRALGGGYGVSDTTK